MSHQKKNQNFSLRSGVVFSLTRLIFFSLIESGRFWFVTSQGLWEFKKRKKFTISRIICPSNAQNSNVQSFPEIKNFFPGRMSLCIVQESNPCQQLGRRLCYHYTNNAVKDYDQRDEFQNFQLWIFPYTFSECYIRKKPKSFFEKRSKFFAKQTNLFSFNRKLLLFLVCYFSRSMGIQKTTRIYYFRSIFSI